ncbi:hypothetical protein C2857_004953, partial [Epichloe festucae Fl1]
CSGLWLGYHYCVAIPKAFRLRSLYHADCTGKQYNDVTIVGGSDGTCINTNCQAASLDVAAIGNCPNGQVQISYWEDPGCSGKWFGYGYTSRGKCHKLWTEGWNFKSLHLRCASEEADCVNQRTCTYDPKPARGRLGVSHESYAITWTDFGAAFADIRVGSNEDCPGLSILWSFMLEARRSRSGVIPLMALTRESKPPSSPAYSIGMTRSAEIRATVATWRVIATKAKTSADLI